MMNTDGQKTGYLWHEVACSPDVAADDQDRADLEDRAAKAGQHNGQDSGDLTGAFSFGLVSALASVPRPD
jgi:hypothetical protein